MLKDFLFNEDEVVLENASAMAVMMGEDSEVTMEGASEIFASFKARGSKIIAKIRAFIAKIVNWIKEKFFDLMKRNLEVDQNLWNDAQKLLKHCDQVQGNLIGKLVNKIKATVAIKQENLESFMTLKAQIEDSVKEIKHGDAYNALHTRSYKYDKEDGAKFIRVSGKQLQGQNQEFQQMLKTFQEQAASIEKAFDDTKEDGKAKYLEIQFASVQLGMEITEIRISTINKIFSMSKTAKKED